MVGLAPCVPCFLKHSWAQLYQELESHLEVGGGVQGSAIWGEEATRHPARFWIQGKHGLQALWCFPASGGAFKELGTPAEWAEEVREGPGAQASGRRA